MDKKLSEMTLEELWRLFPVVLTEHNPHWREWFEEEEKRLREILSSGARIYHIGSTAINGIWAKPIVDILIEVDEATDLSQTAALIKERGYIIMSAGKERISLNRGYTEKGFAERVFHVHLQHCGDKSEVLFRDYLNEHLDVAKDYERLKLELWKKYEHNRDAYTDAKGAFVKKYTAIARRGQEDERK